MIEFLSLNPELKISITEWVGEGRSLPEVIDNFVNSLK